ncbi:hypothetical protein HID58_065235 [Brassica napus]|uniref:Uncharacterized protein n=1 Tax=Brassica napus TaxID=3708 RepID=A0ABQ7ZC80_BRANA|nr:hypothetical protein HID58_065235 [Brassica napus]
MDESTPIEATPFSYLIPSFADDEDNLMENISSPTFQGVTPLQTVDDETPYTTPPPIPQASPLQPTNEENYNTPTPSQPLLLATPLSFVPPSDESNTVDVDPSIGPIKRGRGRPKGSKNSKPSKKKLGTSHPNNEVVVSGQNDETHNNTSLSPHPPLVATNLQAIVPYDHSDNNSLADDDAAPSSDAIKRGRGRPKGSSVKKLKPNNPDDKMVIFCPSFDSMITEEEKENGNEELVDSVRMRFNAVCRRLGHVSSEKAVVTTAFSIFNKQGVRTNKKKRVGPVPGVKPGDIFYFWGEMCLVGLHTQMPAGIDYLLTKDGAAEGLTTSVVTSVGHYNDRTDELHTLVYTGQGGTCKDGKPRDQELTRGNLALVASQKKGNEVRVIRGVEDPSDKKGKVYIYDGLYVVTHYWIEKGTTGFNEFKFNLVRQQDQPPGFATWRLAEELMKCGSSNQLRKGFVFGDISLGLEALPVPIVNEVDENDKEWPLDFNYRVSSKNLSMMIIPNHQSTGCNNTCKGGQSCGDPMCSCIQRNGGQLQYDNRILLYRRPMIYECSDLCACPADCKNRLTQSGLKLRLEVFKTKSCGWGLRSWEPIRAGTFICELVDTVKERDEIEEDDEYVFDTSRVYKKFRWNYEPELVGEDCWDQVSEVYKLRSEILVSARAFGNRSMKAEAGFLQDGQPSVRIAFFAKRHIPPLTELRYDYEISYDTGEVDEDGSMVFRGGTMNRNLWVKTVGMKPLKMANQPSICIAFFAKRHIPPLTELRDNYGMYYNTGEVDEDRSMVFRGTSRVYKNFRLSYEPELVGEDCWDEVSEVYKLRSEILVMRERLVTCSANVMWQPVEFEKDGQPLVRIAFFAKRHIPPLTEVRYDYGMSYDTGEVDEDGSMIFRGFTFAIDESTPIEATPFSYLIPSFADNDNHQMENISSPTSQVVTPLQSPNGPIKRGRGRCNGMSYDTGKVDEDGNMIFRGKRGWRIKMSSSSKTAAFVRHEIFVKTPQILRAICFMQLVTGLGRQRIMDALTS